MTPSPLGRSRADNGDGGINGCGEELLAAIDSNFNAGLTSHAYGKARRFFPMKRISFWACLVLLGTVFLTSAWSQTTGGRLPLGSKTWAFEN